MPYYDKMNPEIKAKWLEALRSGRFKQTKGSLAKAPRYGAEARYCCLGVLCEIAAEEGVIPWEWYGTILTFNGMDTVLPLAVTEWAGLRDRPGSVRIRDTDGNLVTLVHLNDARGYTFDAIADVIEEQL